ncbi:MAG: hydantoinase/oxoprolinase family protein [Alphaproteobacteria bacterium]|nr:hydantoinase/oxoprolinase family protein [Alphaproteobacteria bacterium]
MIRIGVDIGGTFTDFALTGAGPELRLHKQLTTADDPSRAVLEGIATLAGAAGIAVADVAEIVHGTTLVTNAVIERKGARTGMLVTAGFRDQLDIALETRYDLFDLRIRFAPPLVPRPLRREVHERLRWDGTVETPLDADGVRAAVAELVEREAIESLAICFLHSYVDDRHERAARAIVAEAFPALHVSASAEVLPAMREFERWTTTTVNAYAMPGFDRYLGRLEDGLAALGFAGRLYLMSSSGGVVTPRTARRFPVRMLESGPAAGVLMSARHGRDLGVADLLSFDLGGTTAKGALVRDGRPLKHYEMEVARCYEHKRGSGLPLKLPVIDMTEIGAGGGSIVGIDDRGLMRVGPRSAGADPGPACYGRGGVAATLTDANLILGYLDPGFFLGGAMALDRARAEEAVRAAAAPLGLDLVRAAWGIHEIINEDIARAFRIHAVERGFDARRATMVAFGGGGPIHAMGVARKLRIPRVVFPVGAGVMSALGLLASPLSFEVARSAPCLLRDLDGPRFAAILHALQAEATSFLRDAGLADADIRVDRRIDLRYRGQGYEVEIAVPDDDLEAAFAALPARFAERYAAQFGVALIDEPLEAVTWKVAAAGPEPALPASPTDAAGTADATAARKGGRAIYLPEAGGFADVAVYDRYRLRPGHAVAGPALIEERESTVLLRPGDRVVVDPRRNLVADIAA